MCIRDRNEAAGNGITILPTEIQLNQKTKSQRFIVYQTTETGGIGRALRASEYTVDLSNPQIASLEGQNLTALDGGSGEIHISSNTGEKVTAKVVVSNTDAQPEWSFRHDIENILTKLGCNSGACHGALAGKGGFVFPYADTTQTLIINQSRETPLAVELSMPRPPKTLF